MASDKERYQSDTINIEELIQTYTWKRFVKTKPLLRRPFYRKTHFTVDFNWAYLDFKHETTKFQIRKDSFPSHVAEVVTKSQETRLCRGECVNRHGNKNIILYKAQYANHTPVGQTYNVNATRETKASCNVEILNTYTKGTNYNIELKIPIELVAVSAGHSSSEELVITDRKGETFEETMTWAINHDVSIVSGHTAEVTLSVSERNTTADFEIKTTVSLPDGRDLPVYVKRASDDSIVYMDVISDLEFVFGRVAKERTHVHLVNSRDPTRNLLRKNVIITTNGTCRSVSWKKHDVHVKSVLSPELNSEIVNGDSTLVLNEANDIRSTGVDESSSTKEETEDSVTSSSGVDDCETISLLGTPRPEETEHTSHKTTII